MTLDDRVADEVDLTSFLGCRITLTRTDEAFARAIADWDFAREADGRQWTGSVAGPDRLRFLGMLSRYAGLLAAIEMHEQPFSAGRVLHG